jgi:hypothetical protein
MALSGLNSRTMIPLWASLAGRWRGPSQQHAGGRHKYRPVVAGFGRRSGNVAGGQEKAPTEAGALEVKGSTQKSYSGRAIKSIERVSFQAGDFSNRAVIL